MRPRRSVERELSRAFSGRFGFPIARHNDDAAQGRESKEETPTSRSKGPCYPDRVTWRSRALKTAGSVCIFPVSSKVS